MEKCQRCRFEYPDGFTALIHGTLRPLVVCGICALKISNKILKAKRKKFDGPAAEEMRLKAVKYRDQQKKK